MDINPNIIPGALLLAIIASCMLSYIGLRLFKSPVSASWSLYITSLYIVPTFYAVLFIIAIINSFFNLLQQRDTLTAIMEIIVYSIIFYGAFYFRREFQKTNRDLFLCKKQ